MPKSSNNGAAYPGLVTDAVRKGPACSVAFCVLFVHRKQEQRLTVHRPVQADFLQLCCMSVLGQCSSHDIGTTAKFPSWVVPHRL